MQTSGGTLQQQSTIKNFLDLRSRAIKSRINGLYSYNVFDNPLYIRSKKVEQKILKMQDALEKTKKDREHGREQVHFA